MKIKKLLLNFGLIFLGVSLISSCGNKKDEPKNIKVEYINVTTNATEFVTNKTIEFAVQIYPINATNKAFEWSLSNPEIASISSDGKFLANTTGELDVIASAKDGSNVKGSYHLSIGYNPSEVLRVTKQPETVTISYPSGVAFDFEVNLPSKVKSYQWEAGTYNSKGEFSSFQPIKGSAAKQRRFVMPGTDNETSRLPFRCHMVDVDGNDLYTEPCEYILDNMNEFVPVAYLCDYPILPNKTLDLASTPYGSGTISCNADGSHFVFDHVNFDNLFYDSTFIGIGFMFCSNNSTIKDYVLEFKGDNTFVNSYWNEDYNEGGAAFTFVFTGKESLTENVTFTGDGTLFITGGTFAVKAYTNVIWDIDATISGQPKRLTKGFVTYGFTLKKNRTINANIGGHVIFTESEISKPKFLETDLVLEEGSKVIANINPGSVSVGATSLSCLSAANNLIINNAMVDIDVNVDSAYLINNFHSLNPFVGLNANNGDIYITNSDINIKLSSSNDDSVDEELYDIPSVADAYGMSGRIIDVTSSKININLKSSHLARVNGIYSADVHFLDCDVRIEVSSYESASGIIAPFNLSTPGSVHFEYCNAYIDVENIMGIEEEVDPYLEAGIRAKQILLEPSGNGKIIVNTNIAPVLVCTYGLLDEPVEPVEPVLEPEICLYEPVHLRPMDNGEVSCWVEYHYNRSCCETYVKEEDPQSNGYVKKYIAYETMYEFYEPDLLKYYVHHIEISSF